MTATSPWYLALDQGGHSSRALVLDSTGNIVAKAQVAIDTQVISDTHIEHCANELADSLHRCCELVAQELGDKCSRIIGAGLATQRSSIACWRRSTGEPLTPVLSWQDRRAADLIDRHHDEAATVKHLTGLVMSPHYGASKLQWCLTHDERVIQARASGDLTIGPLASFLVRALTGSSTDVCDPANASRTLLWDRLTRDWSPWLCELFAIDVDLLPISVPTRYSYGDLTAGKHAIPLTLVTGDQSAAIYAFGPHTGNVAYINLGTGAFVQAPVGEQAADVEGLLNSVVYQDDTRIEYVLEGTVNGAGRALTWWSERHNLDAKKLVRSATGLVSDDAGLEAGIPIFINGISGLGAPYWLSDFDSEFLDVAHQGTVDPTPEAGAIAILDSIAFLLNANIARINTHTPALDKLVLTGGLASVDYLCQKLADVSGIETVRSSLREATAKGAGYLLSEDPEWPDLRELTRFSPETHPVFERRHAAWQQRMADRLAKATD